MYQSRTRRTWPGHSRRGSASALLQVRELLDIHLLDVRRREGGQRTGGMLLRGEMLDGALGIGRPHAGHQLQGAKRRHLIARVVDPAQHREQILDVRGPRGKRRPPYFTNGICRRASSISSKSLWLPLRNSTAWRCRGMCASRRLSTSLHTDSACVARSSTVTIRGRLPGAARGQQVFAELSRRIGHQRV